MQTEREPDDSPQLADTNDTETEGILSESARKSTAARLRAFLDAYAQTGRVKHACKIAGIAFKTHYRKLQSDPAYRTAFEQAEQQVGQILEDLAVERVREGNRRLVLYQGEPVTVNGEFLYEVEYDHHLHHVLLKRFKREAYKERIEQQISGEITIADRIGTARKRVLELNRSAQDTDPEDLAG
ncbi:MAG TPA: hypothetical protein VKD24_05860 [Candidatus Angelobacter sp.]|nr:hypothetical protein [Candidatus Angelobacter sp.]